MKEVLPLCVMEFLAEAASLSDSLGCSTSPGKAVEKTDHGAFREVQDGDGRFRVSKGQGEGWKWWISMTKVHVRSYPYFSIQPANILVASPTKACRVSAINVAAWWKMVGKRWVCCKHSMASLECILLNRTLVYLS